MNTPSRLFLIAKGLEAAQRSAAFRATKLGRATYADGSVITPVRAAADEMRGWIRSGGHAQIRYDRLAQRIAMRAFRVNV